MPQSPLLPEVDLLARYRDGDVSAFRAFVDSYRDRIVQFFYRLCLDRERAEDLAQDLFLKLLLRSDRYQAQGRMSVYVFRVATNLWIDVYRQNLPRPRLHSYDQVGPHGESPRAEFASAERSPAQQFVDQEDLSVLREALGRLPMAQRQVLELAVYQQLPYARVGEILGIPVGTVKSRVHHAVLALQGWLGRAAVAVPAGVPARVRAGRTA